MDKYIKVENFVMKCRAYPNKEQREKIDQILDGMRVAYNVTAYEISHNNEQVTKKSKKDENILFPNFSACMKKEWLDYLRDNHEIIKEVPSTSLSSSCYGVFGKDMKKAWESKGKLPCGKWEPIYYSKKKPRRSFTVQTPVSGFIFDESKPNTVYVGVTNIGKIKVRGWRKDIKYGETPDQTFEEFYKDKKKAFGVTVSIDNCGDYYIVVMLQTVWKPDWTKEKTVPVGIDVGIKDIAITSNGTKYENKRFKKEEKRRNRRLNRKLSRRYGWANEVFREEHKKDTEIATSNSYERTKKKIAKLDRKIARRRENYNHFITKDIVSEANFIGIESLNVKGMMKNRHLSYALGDAAMSDVLSKLKYKSDWNHVPLQEIGRWEPSTKTCSVCGYKNQKIALAVREWTCPECGTHHDRDINAAKNILAIAQKMQIEN